MPFVFVENEPIIKSYHGVSIYRLSRNDQLSAGYRTYWFTTDPMGYEDDEDSFDIREIEGYDPDLTIEQNLVNMIDAGRFEKTEEVQSRFYSDEAEQRKCPVCGADLSDDCFIGEPSTENKKICLRFKCAECGITGREIYKLVFVCCDVD